jgi:hypothetical protein
MIKRKPHKGVVNLPRAQVLVENGFLKASERVHLPLRPVAAKSPQGDKGNDRSALSRNT